MSTWWSNTEKYLVKTYRIKEIRTYLLDREIHIRESGNGFIEFATSYDEYDNRAQIEYKYDKNEIVKDIFNIDKNATIYYSYLEASEIPELNKNKYCEYKIIDEKLVGQDCIKDKEVAKMLCKRAAYYYDFLAEDLKKDIPFTVELIKKEYQIYLYLSDEIREKIEKDRKIIYDLIKNNRCIYNILSKELQEDPEIEYYFGGVYERRYISAILYSIWRYN